MQSQRSNDRRVELSGDGRKNGILEWAGIILSYFLLVVFFPIAIFFCVVVVSEYQRIVVFRCGRLRKKGVRGPGVFFVLPCVDDVITIDLRTTSFNVPAQDVLTKDSVTIQVDGIVYYHFSDPLKAVLQVKDPRKTTENLAQTKLRSVAGSKTLAELLASREAFSQDLYRAIYAATEEWGVIVERVEIKDIILPPSMRKALAQEAQALRDAQAKLASAEGEQLASKSFKAASDIMTESPYSLQLRYLDTLRGITKEKDTTIIFPVPVDILPPGTFDCRS